jgi:hypothetical protein
MPKSLRLLVVFAVLSWISSALFLGAAYLGSLGAAAIFAAGLGGSIVGVFAVGGRP